MTPQFKFILTHSMLYPDGVEVPQPIGWKDAKLILERHQDYHGVIEYFEGDFIWYGLAMRIIREVEEADGAEGQLQISISLSYKIGVWVDIFSGLIDISMLEEYSKGGFTYKIKAPIINNGVWSKFINRKATPVNLNSSVDQDGNTMVPASSFLMRLPSQKLRLTYEKSTDYNNITEDSFIPASYRGEDGLSAVFSFLPNNSTNKINELPNEVVEYPCTINNVGFPTGDDNYFASNSFYLYKAKTKSSFSLRLKLRAKFVLLTQDGAMTSLVLRWYYRIKRKGTFTGSVLINTLTPSVSGSTFTTIFDPTLFSGSFNFEIGDELYVYGTLGFVGGTAFEYDFYTDYNVNDPTSFAPVYSEMAITADTIYRDTLTDSILLEDAAKRIIRSISGEELTSDISDCFKKYTLHKGEHLRGFRMSAKPMSMSWDDWFAGTNPLLPIGVGQTADGKVKIKNIAGFYNKETCINIGNIAGITRKYDISKFIKKLDLGYQKVAAESKNGTDDVQSSRTYRTKFQTIGKDLTLKSKFFAAANAIEQTIRNGADLTKDWRLDQDTMIIAVKPLDGGWTPELGSDFESVTNVINSATKYNVRLFVMRCFERWRKILQTCLFTGDKFFFVTGELNYKATSILVEGDCEYGDNPSIAENQDMVVTSDIKAPLLAEYMFKQPLSWDQYNTIRSNRDNAIGLSRNLTAYTPHFINKLSFTIARGYAEFDVKLGDRPTEENGFRLLEDDSFRLLEGTGKRLIE